jgi:hypothetical protein
MFLKTSVSSLRHIPRELAYLLAGLDELRIAQANLQNISTRWHRTLRLRASA